MQVTIEDKVTELFEAVKALGPGWHDRQEVADHLAKNRLNPVEVTALELLASQGRLERDLQPSGKREHVMHWVYRVKED